MAGSELQAKQFGLDMDRLGFFLAAIDDGGDTAFATKCAGGSLARPFARFGRQGKSVAHGHYLSRLVSVTGTPPGMTMPEAGALSRRSAKRQEICNATATALQLLLRALYGATAGAQQGRHALRTGQMRRADCYEGFGTAIHRREHARTPTPVAGGE